jgi:hypothetical protein
MQTQAHKRWGTTAYAYSGTDLVYIGYHKEYGVADDAYGWDEIHKLFYSGDELIRRVVKTGPSIRWSDRTGYF